MTEEALCMMSGELFSKGEFHKLAYSNFSTGKIYANRQEHLVINTFSKHFKCRLFINGNRFMKFMKIYPLE